MLVIIEGARGGEGGEQDNARGTRDVPTSQTVTHPLILQSIVTKG
jgi:hypothetical protein